MISFKLVVIVMGSDVAPCRWNPFKQVLRFDRSIPKKGIEAVLRCFPVCTPSRPFG